MQKSVVRKEYRAKRMHLTAVERSKLDDLLLIQFQMAEFPFINYLLSYWPIEENHEPNTHLFTEFLRFRNPELHVCYPIADFETLEMRAVATDIDTPFEKRTLNIYEPKADQLVQPDQLDMIFVPLLAFDTKGYRVGYGKGFYDKYLVNCSPSCIKAGFSYFDPVDNLEDRSDFDIPLDICITPTQQYVF